MSLQGVGKQAHSDLFLVGLRLLLFVGGFGGRASRVKAESLLLRLLVEPLLLSQTFGVELAEF